MRNPSSWIGSRWLWSVCIFLPMAGVYLNLFLDPPLGWVFTGFVQYDQPSYMAFAREYFDDGFSWRYGLPFSSDPDSAKVYLQPQTFLLGWILRLTGWDPGLIYVAFGVVSGILMFRVAIWLLEVVVPGPDNVSFITAAAFAWGGGLLWVPGAVALLAGLGQVTPANLSQVLFAFDPAQGYWFQNLGRNAYFAIEAYYHALFLLAAVLLLTRRWFSGWCVAALLSASHPWSGIQLLLILGTFCITERLMRRRDVPPFGYCCGIAAICTLHLGYYLYFLGWASPEHREVQQQWLHDWSVDAISVLFGYMPIGVLAVICLRRRGWHVCLTDRTSRFLIVWFLVSLALMKHDLIMSPIQPAHFTRGYAWIPLFLLAANCVAVTLNRAAAWRTNRYVSIVAISLFLLVVSDNALWFGQNYLTRLAFAITGTTSSYKIDEDRNQVALMRPELRAVFRFLAERDPKASIVVSNDAIISYLATVYTPLRSWRSHIFSTPQSDLRQREIDTFFARGQEPSGWRDRSPLIIVSKVVPDWKEPPQWEGRFHVILDTGRIVVMER